MGMVDQLLTSLIATGAFGIIFNVPRKKLLQCGFVGMVGWMAYVLLIHFHFDNVVATLAASVLIGIISQGFAKFYRAPIIIFSVSGMIPLVPGGMAYDAMRHFVQNDYNGAIQLAAKAFMLAGAIALGIVISEVLNQSIKKSKNRRMNIRGGL
ncbi:threonine/serine exporter family protein [Heyndrickxia acidicola]|uniref:Threonine/serine exporter family protein n=1 Tax=Heyndrickxia acidicola TaxID=209389 RepID=A0ABU6MIE1_9BACI|nr:threonine/serine exporter family protein [Heyndrickxia acidicola]MED1202830.1 threonine/serine exporter family protein [Heyndrickxia acidicola]